ncbi:MAG: TIM barrel protein [Roseobacter sp.]
MRIAAHLGYMWQDVPLLDRVHLAADAGFDGVDIPTPYELPAKELQRALLTSGLPLVTIAAPPPNYTGGDQGYLARPGAESRFEHDFKRAVRFASALNIPMMHLLAGPVPVGDDTQAFETMQRNLDWAVGQAGDIKLLVGASHDTALHDPAQAVELVDKVAHDALQLLVEVGDAAVALPIVKEDTSLIGQISLYATAKRACPAKDGGSLKPVFEALKKARYDGWISAAYAFAAKDKDPLRWRKSVAP